MGIQCPPWLRDSSSVSDAVISRLRRRWPSGGGARSLQGKETPEDPTTGLVNVVVPAPKTGV